METKEYFEKVMFFENLPSMVFTPPSVPPLAGDRNLRSEGENRPTRCSEPLRYKVGGPKRSSSVFAGWDRLGWSGCCLGIMGCLMGLIGEAWG